MQEIRIYTRNLTKTQKEKHKNKYDFLLRRSRSGYLTPKAKKRLLGITKTNFDRKNNSQFFSDICEYAKTSFGDSILLFDILNHDQLEKIFATPPFLSKSEELIKNKMSDDDFYQTRLTFLNLIDKIFTTETRKIHATRNGKITHQFNEPIEEDNLWRVYLSEMIIKICFRFLKEHRYIPTKAQWKLLDDIEEMINVEVSRGVQIDISKRVYGHA